MKLLLKHGANPLEKDDENKAPLDLANDEETRKLLQESAKQKRQKGTSESLTISLCLNADWHLIPVSLSLSSLSLLFLFFLLILIFCDAGLSDFLSQGFCGTVLSHGERSARDLTKIISIQVNMITAGACVLVVVCLFCVLVVRIMCQMCDSGLFPQGDCCEGCGKKAQANVALKRCGNCKAVYYCGRKCQKQDWKNGHKDKCDGICFIAFSWSPLVALLSYYSLLLWKSRNTDISLLPLICCK